MDTTQQLTFLQERIEEIGSAIFYNLSDAVLKLPTSVVSTVKVDDYGFVWLLMQKPKQHLNEFEQEFPVKLDFYKKGKGYFLQVAGKGFVVSDPEEMNLLADLSEQQNALPGNTTLVKVKIQRADYYQTRSQQKTPWWQTAWNYMVTLVRHNSYDSGNHTYFPAS